MLHEGQQVELTIDKPAAGGRMIARHLGQVVLVRGAIPGERVQAWIERVDKRLAFAVTRDVLAPSPDRRSTDGDPLCGGALYAHIAYSRQLAIKSDILRDAFARLGRHPLDSPIDVAASPEHGYRMRARLHVHRGRAGFYREGSHQLCDAASTRQLLPDSITAAQRIAALSEGDTGAVTSLVITENIAGAQRAVHLELAAQPGVTASTLDRLVRESGVVGISARDAAGQLLVSGDAVVSDPLPVITGCGGTPGNLVRHAESFFQGNRYLLGDLVRAVLAAVPDTGEVLDLYAGVGLFAVALAAAGHLEVTAVEGDRSSGGDLRRNARPHEPRIAAHVASVEDYLVSRRGRSAPAAVIVDPPRTGVSSAAVEGIIALASPRVVYVSCDPATLARDARRLLDAHYRLTAIRAFDLFPNTPHVEALAVFEKTE